MTITAFEGDTPVLENEEYPFITITPRSTLN